MLEVCAPKCGACLQNPPAFDRLITAGFYQAPFGSILTKIKYHQRWQFCDYLAKRLVLTLESCEDLQRPDCIIPIPMHTSRLVKRGFNQALELARAVAKPLNIPLETNYCIKILETIPQSELKREQRLANLTDAFALTSTKTLESVAIIDDVVTTGSTVGTVARLLKQAGVKNIQVWCVARTLLKA